MLNSKNHVFFNIYEKSLLLGLIFSVLFNIVNFSAKCHKISEKVLRLHIIANSDSDEDQNLKLRVRDNILKYFSRNNFASLEETKIFASEHINDLVSLSQDEVFNSGFDYNVSGSLCKSSFNTRIYDNFTLPAGVYDSLKIIIGDGKGKNWWCVIFPPMCVPTAEDYSTNDDSYNDNFEDDEKNIIENEPRYKVKFKIIEIIEKLHEYICNLINYFWSFFDY